MMRRLVAAGIAVTLLGQSGDARADEHNPTNIDWKVDGIISGSAFAGIFLMMLLPVDRSNRWQGEIFGSLDEPVKDNFSRTAAHLSDGLVTTVVAAPLLLKFADGVDENDARFALVYGETLGLSLLANSIAKYTVQRPRPYVYNRDPQVREYREDAGDDAYVSFYSGHASMSFSAAIAGSYLYALESDNENAKAAIWGVELGLATATSLLRVRAGKHFYSDILVGAAAGSAIGLLVPALHTNGGIYRPSGKEWAAMAAGIGIGGLFGQFFPTGSESESGQNRGALQSVKLA
ncbi:MAG: phosphatase PAP2 family protein, partial [Kofleriaceae bacterium]|nr:phosphatase PAP2 family protein [Kofleriaceae bacterium]